MTVEIYTNTLTLIQKVFPYLLLGKIVDGIYEYKHGNGISHKVGKQQEATEYRAGQ